MRNDGTRRAATTYVSERLPFDISFNEGHRGLVSCTSSELFIFKVIHCIFFTCKSGGLCHGFTFVESSHREGHTQLVRFSSSVHKRVCIGFAIHVLACALHQMQIAVLFTFTQNALILITSNISLGLVHSMHPESSFFAQ